MLREVCSDPFCSEPQIYSRSTLLSYPFRIVRTFAQDAPSICSSSSRKWISCWWLPSTQQIWKTLKKLKKLWRNWKVTAINKKPCAHIYKTYVSVCTTIFFQFPHFRRTHKWVWLTPGYRKNSANTLRCRIEFWTMWGYDWEAKPFINTCACKTHARAHSGMAIYVDINDHDNLL